MRRKPIIDDIGLDKDSISEVEAMQRYIYRIAKRQAQAKEGNDGCHSHSYLSLCFRYTGKGVN